MRPLPDPTFEIAFIGSGISCTAVLMRLLDQLLSKQESRPARPVSIAVIDKDAEPWKGVPYGNRSSMHSLTITTLGEFLPDSERGEFLNWLEAAWDGWRERLESEGGATGRSWLAGNEAMIAERRWEEMYVPRQLFGEYLQEKITERITQAEDLNLVRVTFIQGYVTDLSTNTRGEYEVAYQTASPGTGSLVADKVILCLGSPPIKSLDPQGLLGPDRYIHDTYGPSVDHTLLRVRTALEGIESPAERNVLVLGSNASALELLYLIQTTDSLRDLVGSVQMLSSSGQLPRRITPGKQASFPFPHMTSLQQMKDFTAEDLMKATREDIGLAEKYGVSIADAYGELSDLVIMLIGRLPNGEKEKFHCYSGADYSRLIRRAGPEYRDAADRLQTENRLRIWKGSFDRVLPGQSAGSGFRVSYIPSGASAPETLPDSFQLVINCGGFEELSGSSSSELIANLIRRNTVEVNCTGRGLRVSESFEAAERLYVMGPLLGGIFNNKSQLWHVENAKSIFYLSALLVNEMMEALPADVD
ncbi:MAG TPA: FAD/NAD(P)-binding protein [Chitinophagaceae bacterium]|nr:FAD/NAD(P)-binding protein [Chitinophagaceae bacterium]